ncbi:hypothetical protein B0O80DRAFT_421023 [Mortierella sp. GBAus27b]|nr:hypothetical protein B0O80DRAFT_421023 [Mortierella sp. GBAus27b]
MASVMLFPTVATHRRLPHLPPKKEKSHPVDHHPAPDHPSLNTTTTPSSPSTPHTVASSPATAIDHAHSMAAAPSQPLLQAPSPLSMPLPACPPTAVHDKSIKSALYDAFGCLYHPVQHTHHPLSATASNTPTPTSAPGTCTTPCLSSACGPSAHTKLTTTAALRSSDGPIGISPKGSPALVPHAAAGGSSAPVTPLEWPSSLSPGIDSSPTSPGSIGSLSNGAGSSNWHNFFSHHTHPHLDPQRRRSSCFHPDEDGRPLHFHETASPSKTATTASTTTTTRSSRRPSLDETRLNPIEHPVLCSLQTWSLTHPHPPEYYHPHLGHDLGHDRVPIMDLDARGKDSGNAGRVAQTLGQQQQHQASLSPTQPPALTASSRQPQHPLTPKALLSNAGTGPLDTSPFPMDHGLDVGRFSQHGLV